MKRFRWSSIIFLLCLMYFTTAGAVLLKIEIDFTPLSVPTQHRDSHIHLRPTATTPETLTLYEQARANLVAQ